jgi:hypothetical protein
MSNKHPTKPFQKGDPRINRKGRPKDFLGLRSLAQAIAIEKIASKDGMVVMSRIELLLRDWASSKNDKLNRAFVEYAFGKVTDELNVEVNGKIKVIEIVKDYGNDPRPD